MSGANDEASVWAIVEEWIAKAEADRQSVTILLTAGPALLGVAAFHCQQAAEKLLKGFLVLAGHRFRKTHELKELGRAVKIQFPALADLVGSVEDWTIWSFAYRYPAEDNPPAVPSSEVLMGALNALDRLMSALRSKEPGNKN